MTLLDELLDEKNEHPLAIDFRTYHEEAKEYRKIIKEAKIPQTFGIWTNSLSNLKEKCIEQDSFGVAARALYTALQYITEKMPLDLPEYFALQEMIITQYPHSMWDNGMWFKRVGKEVRDYNLPCTPQMKELLEYNTRLSIQFPMAVLFAQQQGLEVTEAFEQMKMGLLQGIVIEQGQYKKEEIVREKPSNDSLQMYLVLTGKIKREKME